MRLTAADLEAFIKESRDKLLGEAGLPTDCVLHGLAFWFLYQEGSTKHFLEGIITGMRITNSVVQLEVSLTATDQGMAPIGNLLFSQKEGWSIRLEGWSRGDGTSVPLPKEYPGVFQLQPKTPTPGQVMSLASVPEGTIFRLFMPFGEGSGYCFYLLQKGLQPVLVEFIPNLGWCNTKGHKHHRVPESYEPVQVLGFTLEIGANPYMKQ